jgi:hypothetical protein
MPARWPDHSVVRDEDLVAHHVERLLHLALHVDVAADVAAAVAELAEGHLRAIALQARRRRGSAH